MGVSSRHVIMYGADIRHIVKTLRREEDVDMSDAEFEAVDDFNNKLYEKYDPNNKNELIYVEDCYGDDYLMFGYSIFVSKDARWDSDSIPLISPKPKKKWDKLIRDELKALLPDHEEAIDALKFDIWVFTHHS